MKSAWVGPAYCRDRRNFRGRRTHAAERAGQVSGWSWLAPLFVGSLILLATVEPVIRPKQQWAGTRVGASEVVFCYGATRAICQRFPRSRLAPRSG